MKLSSIAGKEIVNLATGERLGVIAESDLVIDESNGKILSLIIPRDRGFFSLKREKKFMEVPWKNIKKIGNDMIIIDYEGNI
ncbi:sporulation protein, YlmC/YmxH family [Alkalithermobacter thermoalcaliphilus JW-YL-7 = DSM 7308]|uniref:Sporulation protein, YlmC/YmxH family n=1 Tax=Alkalithermobacter thermoalcaliphilus JW-YL-7 = DSM 7308 TaxID=1121328 RepID=A0A150FQB6_CLOPD|nr:sporulation protein, YlmC/YmxH family [[Clostridium] paradoxum JW-YL-7 = DSM 7308]SHK59294.1 sporulation protein, YlmC/YmxH family [[Clostridium] paradoxum JW-YL-7 = DSM 7308]